MNKIFCNEVVLADEANGSADGLVVVLDGEDGRTTRMLLQMQVIPTRIMIVIKCPSTVEILEKRFKGKGIRIITGDLSTVLKRDDIKDVPISGAYHDACTGDPEMLP